jgi:hypothetical protein
MRAPSSKPNYLPKASPPNTIPLGVRIPMDGWREVQNASIKVDFMLMLWDEMGMSSQKNFVDSLGKRHKKNEGFLVTWTWY